MLDMQLVQESREPTGLGAQQAVEGFLSNKFMVVGGRPNYVFSGEKCSNEIS